MNVVCCFCGESLDYDEAVVLVVYPNSKSEEGQQLYCHKEHLIDRLHESICLCIDCLE